MKKSQGIPKERLDFLIDV